MTKHRKSRSRKKLTVHRKSFRVKPTTFKRKGKTIHRKGFTVKATTYKIKDRGKPGRTPKREKWFKPKTVTGWKKSQTAKVRRRHLKKGRVSDVTAGRRAQALANVTTDRRTKQLAKSDAQYFFRKKR